MKDYAKSNSSGRGFNRESILHGVLIFLVILLIIAVVHEIFKKPVTVVSEQIASSPTVVADKKSTETEPTQTASNQPTFDFYDVLEDQDQPTTAKLDVPKLDLAASSPTEAPKVSVPKLTTASTPEPAAKASVVKAAPKTVKPKVASVPSPAPAKPVVQAKKTPKPSPSATASASKKPSSRYIIEVGLFTQRKDAQRKRAELMLRGLNVHLSSVKIAQKKYYRLQVGPYTSWNKAHKKQLALEQHQVHAKIIKESSSRA